MLCGDAVVLDPIVHRRPRVDAPPVGLQEGRIDKNVETIQHDEQEQEDLSTKNRMFLAWLRANGARFDSVDWPSCTTESGARGAVAREDIATGVRNVSQRTCVQ